jgi:hypothetical protein
VRREKGKGRREKGERRREKGDVIEYPIMIYEFHV